MLNHPIPTVRFFLYTFSNTFWLCPLINKIYRACAKNIQKVLVTNPGVKHVVFRGGANNKHFAPFLSDLDFVLVLKEKPEEIEEKDVEAIKKKWRSLKVKYPLLDHLIISDLESLKSGIEKTSLGILLKGTSLCNFKQAIPAEITFSFYLSQLKKAFFLYRDFRHPYHKEVAIRLLKKIVAQDRQYGIDLSFSELYLRALRKIESLGVGTELAHQNSEKVFFPFTILPDSALASDLSWMIHTGMKVKGPTNYEKIDFAHLILTRDIISGINTGAAFSAFGNVLIDSKKSHRLNFFRKNLLLFWSIRLIESAVYLNPHQLKFHLDRIQRLCFDVGLTITIPTSLKEILGVRALLLNRLAVDPD